MRRLTVAILPAGLIYGFWLADHPSPARAVSAPAPAPVPVAASAPPVSAPAPVSTPLGNETLTGKVVDLRGKGVVGLFVSAHTNGDRVAGTVTAAEGAFTLEGLARGLYRLEVTGPAIVPAELGRVAAPTDRVVVVVSRAVSIAGRVTDADIPAAGATVEISGPTLDAPRGVEVGPDGRFVAAGLPEGRFVAAARRGARAALDAAVDRTGPGPWPELQLALAPAARLVVTVTGDTGPVAGAGVILGRDGLVRRAPTDANGIARFDGVAPGAAALDVVADGFLPAERLPVALETGDSVALDVSLYRGATVAGRVFDAGGLPIAGAIVELSGDAGNISASTRAQRLAWAAGQRLAPSRRLLPVGDLGVLPGPIPLPPPRGAVWGLLPRDDAPEPAGFRTGPDGSFRIDNVPPGHFRARAAHPDFAPAQADVAGGHVLRVLRRGGEVSGRVTDEAGMPLLAAQMTLVENGRDAAVLFVDKEGRYRFAHVLGEVTVRAAAPGYAPVEKTVRPEEGAHLDLPLFLPAATGAGSGRVLDPTGRPVGGAEVVAAGPGGVKLRARSDATGRFLFAGVSGGPWRVTASHPDFAPMEAALGAEPIDIVLRPGGSLRGEVIDAVTRGPLLAFTMVAEGPGETVKRVFEKGSFALGPLAPGRWRLTVEARGFATAVFEREVRSGEETRGVWLEMQVGAVVGGNVYDQHGEAVSGATVACGLVSTTTDRLGGFKLRGVHPGDVPLVVTHPSAGAAQLLVPLRSGDELSTLEIRLAR